MEDIVIDKEKKGSYLLFLKKENELDEIKFNLPILRTPFGIENFNNKRVINIEFTNMENDNDVHNLYSQISGLEEQFQEQIQVDDFETYGKEFVSCIRKKGKFDPLLRVNVTKDTNIPFNGCPSKSYINGLLRLKKIWTWNDKWGLWFDAISLSVLEDK